MLIVLLTVRSLSLQQEVYGEISVTPTLQTVFTVLNVLLTVLTALLTVLLTALLPHPDIYTHTNSMASPREDWQGLSAGEEREKSDFKM